MLSAAFVIGPTLSPASGNFCRLLITFANSLDPDQARQNVEPDLDPKSKLFDTLMVFLKDFFKKKLILKKRIHRRQKSMQNYPACKELWIKTNFT